MELDEHLSEDRAVLSISEEFAGIHEMSVRPIEAGNFRISQGNGRKKDQWQHRRQETYMFFVEDRRMTDLLALNPTPLDPGISPVEEMEESFDWND